MSPTLKRSGSSEPYELLQQRLPFVALSVVEQCRPTAAILVADRYGILVGRKREFRKLSNEG